MDALNRGRNTIIATAVLILFAFFYYSLIYRYGLNLADEGNVALLSQRLMLGERPFHEVSLGYNVLWFYPISLLFKVFGTNLLLMRGYFYLISAGSGLTAFFLLRRLDAPLWLAFGQGAAVIAVTGQYYKAYIPLLVLTNLFVLALFLTSQRKLLLSIGAGLLLGTTYLIRIDLGIFFTAIWLLGIFSHAILQRQYFWLNFSYAATLCLGTVLMHLPFLYDAHHRRFLRHFVDQYREVAHLIVRPLLPKAHPPLVTSRLQGGPAAVPTSGLSSGPEPSKTAEESPDLLRRRPFRDIFLKSLRSEKRLLAILTYLPVALIGALLVTGLLLFLSKRFPADRWLLFSVLLAGSLTTFPQFFFFRPDLPHLIEFMNGASVGLSCAAWLLWSSQGSGKIFTVFAVAIALTEFFYLLLTLPNQYGGTLALRVNRHHDFRGFNGVDVVLSPEEFQEVNTLFSATVLNSTKKQYVACYPYLPGINFITGRPTFQGLLYVDNTTQGADWQRAEIERIERYQPAVIVIDDWKINGTEPSRFSRWAAETMKFIETNYRVVATFKNKKIFAR